MADGPVGLGVAPERGPRAPLAPCEAEALNILRPGRASQGGQVGTCKQTRIIVGGVEGAP